MENNNTNRLKDSSRSAYLINTESKKLIEIYNSRISKVLEKRRPSLITSPFVEPEKVFFWDGKKKIEIEEPYEHKIKSK